MNGCDAVESRPYSRSRALAVQEHGPNVSCANSTDYLGYSMQFLLECRSNFFKLLQDCLRRQVVGSSLGPSSVLCTVLDALCFECLDLLTSAIDRHRHRHRHDLSLFFLSLPAHRLAGYYYVVVTHTTQTAVSKAAAECRGVLCSVLVVQLLLQLAATRHDPAIEVSVK